MARRSQYEHESRVLVRELRHTSRLLDSEGALSLCYVRQAFVGQAIACPEQRAEFSDFIKEVLKQRNKPRLEYQVWVATTQQGDNGEIA